MLKRQTHGTGPSFDPEGRREGGSRFLVVGPPRGGFTLLLSILNILYRMRGFEKDRVQKSVNHFIPLAADYLDKTMSNCFARHIPLEDLFYSGEFKLLVGGPKWIDTDNGNLICVRKYLGVRDKGDFTFILYLPKFALGYDEVVHSHSHPVRWFEDPDFSSYYKFASVRNPIDIIHSSVYSINALTSEYIIRCLKGQNDDQIRTDLAINKLSDLRFMQGLTSFLLDYLKEFSAVSDRYSVMRWEDLILEPSKTIMGVAERARVDITEEVAANIWKEIEHRNLTRFHQHSFRKGVMGDWKNSITNTHLEMFEKAGFNRYLKEFGYNGIEYFDESFYTPIQRIVEDHIRRGVVYRHTTDENLFVFAFNKTNISTEAYQFKSYPRSGCMKIERSTFRDEELMRGFIESLGKSSSLVNQYLEELKGVAEEYPDASSSAYDRLRDKYQRLFGDEFDAAETEHNERFYSSFRAGEVDRSTPILIETHQQYNIVGMRNRFFAVPQSLGPLNLDEIDMDQYPDILICGSLQSAKAAINGVLKINE